MYAYSGVCVCSWWSVAQGETLAVEEVGGDDSDDWADSSDEEGGTTLHYFDFKFPNPLLSVVTVGCGESNESNESHESNEGTLRPHPVLAHDL